MKTAVGTFFLLLVISGVVSVEWKHSAVLDNNFLVLWTPDEKDVTFEIQVKTLGYVGLGFTKDDGRAGADMVIGWVDNNGQVHLQKLPTFLYRSYALLISVSDRPPDVSYKMESSRPRRRTFSYAVKERRVDRGGGGGRRRGSGESGGEKRRERENDWHLQWEREAFSL
ncbi:MOXD1 like protein 2 [Trachymyrmex zeteki]|uniref:MOXD1 like protein 2 n=1 Tax=Mycetomoellerius zeteki TaxID=64791 RepID=A0A151X7A3_9HYME|nr:MOXD1 like protein 2 [Trachymyrmex zeteki]